MKLSPGRNKNDDMSEVNNKNRRQIANNGGLEGLEIRVRLMHFTPFATGDNNAINIVNTFTHVDLHKLLQGPTEYYNDVNIPMDTILAGQLMWITIPGREDKTANYYKRQTKGSGSTSYHHMFSCVSLLKLKR